MNKLISLGLMVGGVVLIVVGFRAMESVSSDISRFFTEAPTGKAVWLLIGGAVATVAGIFGVSRWRRTGVGHA